MLNKIVTGNYIKKAALS